MSLDASCKPQKEPQVPAELNALEKVQSNLSDRIGELEDRLASIMRDPTPTSKNDTDEASPVSVADRIRNYRYSAENHLSKIMDILDRLEL